MLRFLGRVIFGMMMFIGIAFLTVLCVTAPMIIFYMVVGEIDAVQLAILALLGVSLFGGVVYAIVEGR